MSTTTAARSRAAKDAVLTSPAAIEQARAALAEVVSPAEIGEYLGGVAEAERLVTHRFVSLAPGYRDWHWTVTLSRVPRSRTPTVCETAMLPGDGALLAPPWVPWSQRLQPGDLGTGDVLPYVEDDPRLEQGYESTGEEDSDRLAVWELGLGRPRVLSALGRSQAAQRWYDGANGPRAPQAIAAARACSSCGFFTPLAGSLRAVFGVCANEWSPDDGKVVSVDHGCGAHSETDVDRRRSRRAEHVLDETTVEHVDLDRQP